MGLLWWRQRVWENQTGLSELPRAGYAHIGHSVNTWLVWTWAQKLDKIVFKLFLTFNMHISVIVYISFGLPLVTLVPQLYFPPQVEKFYLGRLFKGKNWQPIDAISIVHFLCLLFLVVCLWILLLKTSKHDVKTKNCGEFDALDLKNVGKWNESAEETITIFREASFSVLARWRLISLISRAAPPPPGRPEVQGPQLRGQEVLHSRAALWTR